MALRKRNAGGGDAPRKRSASWSSEESSVGEEMDFVSDNDMDVDFILDIASDDNESDGDDDDNESDALTSARVWQRVDTEKPATCTSTVSLLFSARNLAEAH